MDFCILGLGIGFTAYEFIKKEITENNLYVLEVEPNIPPRSIGIVTRNEPKSEMINDLISILKKDKI